MTYINLLFACLILFDNLLFIYNSDILNVFGKTAYRHNIVLNDHLERFR